MISDRRPRASAARPGKRSQEPLGRLAGGSTGTVPMSAGRQTSRISRSSEVPISLWRMPPGMKHESPASSRQLVTPRNLSLFLERGHAYVYLVYGSAYMLNVSSEIAGIGAGVLIRAVEPRDGIPIMQRNRQIERLRDLARGPGRLTAALRVDRWLDGLDLCREGPPWLGRGDQEPGEIGQSIRIGISRDANRALRFYLRGSPFVSGPRSLRE